MVMKNFREISVLRVLLVALLVLVVFGAGVPSGAFARVEMQNGHEGDPQDGMDIVSGGGGDQEDGRDLVFDGKPVLNQDHLFDFFFIEFVMLEDRTFVPVFSFDTNSMTRSVGSQSSLNCFSWRAK